jgi:hypothetical protein
MNRSKFLIRLDDIHPQMNKENFQRMIDLMAVFSIKGILGVIPDNQDKSLQRSKADSEFWKKIKTLQEKGYCIAQHGFQHVYDSDNGGILNLNPQSEFAGHSYAIQKEKMVLGKKKLEQKGVRPNLFMAPSHSFDHNTLEVVKELGYGITDGFGLWPRYKKGLLNIPQLFASPFHFGIGLYTICLHTDSMKDSDFFHIQQHIERNHKRFISPNQIQQYTLKKQQYFYKFIDTLAGFLLKILLKIKRQSLS